MPAESVVFYGVSKSALYYYIDGFLQANTSRNKPSGGSALGDDRDRIPGCAEEATDRLEIEGIDASRAGLRGPGLAIAVSFW